MSPYLDPKADVVFKKIFGDHPHLLISQDLLAVPEIAEAVELAQRSPAELASYQSYWDEVSVQKTLLLGAHKEGLAEGRAQGLAEGKAEMAQKMLKSSYPLSAIIDITGLSEAEILALKE